MLKEAKCILHLNLFQQDILIKCVDIIADTIVDRLSQLDSNARVATEIFLSGKHIIIGGEVKLQRMSMKHFIKPQRLMHCL